MKNVATLRVGFLGLVCAEFCAAETFKQSEEVYANISGGKSFFKTIKASEFPIIFKLPTFFRSPGTEELGLSYKPGVNVKAAIGRQLNDFRLEVESAYTKANYKSFTSNGQPMVVSDSLSGYTRLVSFLANVYFDIDINNKFKPFIGGGLGFANIKNHIEQTNLYSVVPGGVSGAPNVKATISENRLAYQAILGARFMLNEKICLQGDYRYFRTEKTKALDSKISHQSISLGLSYFFKK
jgi:opacity protein-like surface antigen